MIAEKCRSCKYESFFYNKCPVKSIKDVEVVNGVGIVECPKYEGEVRV